MFSNISYTISASKVLKTFLNIFVSIECAVVMFHSYKQVDRKDQCALLINRYSIWQESNVILINLINKKHLKYKVVHAQQRMWCCIYEHLLRETNYFQDLCNMQNRGLRRSSARIYS